VLISQQLMLGRTREQAIKNYPFKLAQTYYGQLERVHQWIDKQPLIDLLEVSFADVHNNPRETVQKIVEFLDYEIDESSMIEAVDNKLYRNQTA